MSRAEGTMGIAFTATKHEVHSSIKPGTSASSVSSYGSFGHRVSNFDDASHFILVSRELFHCVQ